MWLVDFTVSESHDQTFVKPWLSHCDGPPVTDGGPTYGSTAGAALAVAQLASKEPAASIVDGCEILHHQKDGWNPIYK